MHIWVFRRELLDDTDSRVAYYSSMFLLKASFLLFSWSLAMICPSTIWSNLKLAFCRGWWQRNQKITNACCITLFLELSRCSLLFVTFFVRKFMGLVFVVFVLPPCVHLMMNTSILQKFVSRPHHGIFWFYHWFWRKLHSLVASTGNSIKCLELLVLDVTWTSLFLVASICRSDVWLLSRHFLKCSIPERLRRLYLLYETWLRQ